MLPGLDDAGVMPRDAAAPDQVAQWARNLIEAFPHPLAMIGAEGRITGVNMAAARMAGVDRDQLAGAEFAACFTEPEQARDAIRTALANGCVADHPLIIHRRDGGSTEVVLTASVFDAGHGNMPCLFAALREVTDHHRTEQRFRTFIEAAPDAMVLASRNGTILLVNNQTERLFGYRRDELLGAPVEVLVPARFRDTHQGHRSKFFREPLMRPMGVGLDLWGARKDGSEFPIEISLSPIESPQGLTVGATIRDVTVQRTASQYARSLIEASLDPLVTISPEGKITDVNEATVKVTGLPRERLVGTDFSDYFTEPERAREGYRQVFARGSVIDYPLTIRHRDQSLTEVLYNASVYKDVRGNVLGVFAGARDMTAQRRAEAEIAVQRARELERLAELERFQRLTVGRELKMIALKKEIAELRARPAGEHGRMTAVHADGEKAQLARTQKAILNILEDAADEKSGLAEVQRAVLNILDDMEVERSKAAQANGALRAEITERARAVEALRHANAATEAANRELEAFSYSVAHDLRAPLRSIDGFSQALLEDCADNLPEEGRAYLGHVRESAQHMARLIDDLLSLSRVGRTVIRRTRVDLAAIARTIFARLQREQPERSLELVIQSELIVTGDTGLLEVALENLLGNAWKFTRKRVPARIELGRIMEGSRPVYFVRDNGAGFDMAYAEKLFAVFQRLHSAVEFEGTGIGLANVERIVHRHGGRIWADGEVGRGATFRFTLAEVT